MGEQVEELGRFAAERDEENRVALKVVVSFAVTLSTLVTSQEDALDVKYLRLAHLPNRHVRLHKHA